jgi:Rrf2 family iron-sulfur cluster assembly transcriptional regulator
MDDKHGCVCGDHCVTHNVWHGLAERIRDFLASITLEELTLEAKGKVGKTGTKA